MEENLNSKKISMAKLNLFPACILKDGESSPKKNYKHPPSKSPTDSGENCLNVAQMGTIRQLSTLSSEYLRIKYLLELSLPDYRIYDDVKIWDLRNPDSIADYEATVHDLLEVESWVSVNDIGSDLPTNQSNKCELSSPLQPMKFTTGFIKMENPSVKGIKQYILCKVAIGKSYIISKEEDGQNKLPYGYHSYYLRPSDRLLQKIDANVVPLPPPEENEDASQYYHEYVIHDSQQVLPLFLVQFNYISLQSLTQLP